MCGLHSSEPALLIDLDWTVCPQARLAVVGESLVPRICEQVHEWENKAQQWSCRNMLSSVRSLRPNLLEIAHAPTWRQPHLSIARRRYINTESENPTANPAASLPRLSEIRHSDVAFSLPQYCCRRQSLSRANLHLPTVGHPDGHVGHQCVLHARIRWTKDHVSGNFTKLNRIKSA